ncbi:uncharacterized protein [Bemisia tabaci]|uniref:uncharacterized protein n=1 Tax=Bemisia tabaci TaxID=7038 RepID=UPI003B285FB4
MADADELTRQKEFLEQKRARIYNCVEKIQTASADVTLANCHMYADTRERVKKLQEDFDACQDEILELNTRLSEDSQIPTVKMQDKFDDLVDCALSNFLRYMKAPVSEPGGAPAAPPPAQSVATTLEHVRLGPLKVPTFDGTVDKWPTFYNLYNAAVHNSTSSNVVKFQRLLSFLTGEPLSMIGTMDITDENYKVAYDMLKDRYQREKHCILRHYHGLLELPMVSNDTQMSQLLAKLREHIHGLTALKHKTESYGNFLVAVILLKFNNFYRRRLDDARDHPTTYPTLSEIISFIKAECTLVGDSDLPSTANVKRSSYSSRNFLSHTASKNRSSYEQIAQRRGYQPTRRVSAADTGPNFGPSHADAPASSSSSPTKYSNNKCKWCNANDHVIYGCDTYLQLDTHDRAEGVKKKGLCYNCLSPHFVSACRSPRNCSVCNGRHHSSLHFEENKLAPATLVNAATSRPPLVPPPHPEALTAHIPISHDNAVPSAHLADDVTQEATQINPLSDGAVLSAALASNSTPAPAYSILPTARVILRSAEGYKIPVRLIFDSGAMSSFLTRRVAQLLHLKPNHGAPDVTGIAESPVSVDGVVTVDILDSKENLAFANARLIVVNRLTGKIPPVSIPHEIREIFTSYDLADPLFTESDYCDCLLGADIFPFLLTGLRVAPTQDGPIGLGTTLGLTVMGPVPSSEPNRETALKRSSLALLTHTLDKISQKIEDFWSIEQVTASKPALTPDEEEAENLYVQTTVQQENGRYKVRLPFRKNHPPLGQSRFQAENRFASLERRFAKDEKFHSLYKDFMKNYKESNFMSVTKPPPSYQQHFYLPHTGVLKNSSTSPLRVVMDASAPTSNGVSLNSILLPGPKLQNDIRDILIYYRCHPVVFSADIRQMFLLIDLHEDDRFFQSILWRESVNDPLLVYRFFYLFISLCPLFSLF